MKNWKRTVMGYLHIRLKGGSPERFLNLCANHGIDLWDLTNRENSYEMNISIQDFYRIKPLCRKSQSRVRIVSKHGLPFFFYRNQKRKAFFAGIFICFFLLFVLSRHIWNIHVEGNLTYSTQSILGFLEKENIKHGIPKREINCTEIASHLRKQFPGIIWVSAKIQGTRLMLQIQENTDQYTNEKESGEEKTPADLIAEKSGKVVSIVTRSGTPLKKAGDSCEKGEILVSGRIDITDDTGEITGYQYVHADADIYLETVYQYYQEFPLSYQNRVYTGRTRTNHFVQIGSLRAAAGKRQASFASYDSVTHTDFVRLTENFLLPVTYGTITDMEYNMISVTLSKTEARKKAETKLSNFLDTLKEKGVQICRNHVRIDVSDSRCVSKGEIIVIEKAGKQQETQRLDLPQETQEREQEES